MRLIPERVFGEIMNLHPIMAAALAPFISPAFPASEIDDEDLDIEDEEVEDEEPHEAICSACSGSGEGHHEGSTCRTCRGSGEVWVTA